MPPITSPRTRTAFANAAPTGRWLDDLVEMGLWVRDVHRRHPWLGDLQGSRATMGPCAVDALEHALTVLDGHPATDGAKLEAFVLLHAIVASFAGQERSGTRMERNTRYLAHVAAAGSHPRIAALGHRARGRPRRRGPVARDPRALPQRTPAGDDDGGPRNGWILRGEARVWSGRDTCSPRPPTSSGGRDTTLIRRARHRHHVPLTRDPGARGGVNPSRTDCRCAAKPEFQSGGDRWRVFTDPAAHPFCLTAG
ncbi:TetR/AcrR family transcriptional regulator C-terminal domain-containing protein [Pseudonocardia nigra]|uniref:TetR/AcrR family transcriptional regulator C-terminal domain-containing protein n=1 Tax=Pseudonocardia nigra TaxID=1921578 RepID=UPI003558C1D5